jgi:lysozyme
MTIIELITKHEGRRRRPYKCSAGANTIGVGHNIDAHPLPSDIAKRLKEKGSIDDEMIDRLLVVDIARSAGDCKKLFPEFNSFSLNRQAALIDWCFQIGFTKANRFVKAVAAINTGRWSDAAAEMRDSTWAKQTPKRAAEITDMVDVG